VWSVVVVPAQPAWEGSGSVVAGGVDVGVGPFALQDADEGFGFAVCARCVGAGADVADVVLGEQSREVGGAVAAAVVGEDALDGGAALVIGSDQAAGDGDAVAGLLGGSQLDLGEAGVVVDGHVRVRPADPVAALRAVTEDALSDVPEPTQLLDVEVHQLARRVVLIPIGRRSWQASLARAVIPPKHPPDRGRRSTQRRRQRTRPPPSVQAKLDDLLLRLP